MGQRGPKPTPTKLLELRGSWRAKDRKKEPKPAPLKPPMPAWLDADGKRLWRHLTNQLHRLGLLSRLDQHALGRYVVLFQRWRKMETFITQYGEMYPVKDKEGEVVGFKVFYQVKLAESLADKLLRLEQHFGMTPAARAQLGVLLAEEPSVSIDASDKHRFFKTG